MDSRPVCGHKFFIETETIFSIYIDVIFGAKILMATVSAKNVRATLPCSRHDPITGASEFILLERDFAALLANHSVEKVGDRVAACNKVQR